jgi:hypothetical protein
MLAFLISPFKDHLFGLNLLLKDYDGINLLLPVRGRSVAISGTTVDITS